MNQQRGLLVLLELDLSLRLLKQLGPNCTAWSPRSPGWVWRHLESGRPVHPTSKPPERAWRALSGFTFVSLFCLVMESYSSAWDRHRPPHHTALCG